MKFGILTTLFLAAATLAAAAELEIVAPWTFAFAGTRFAVPPPQSIQVNQEFYEALPLYRALDNWTAGTVLRQLAAAECSLPGALEAASVQVELADGTPLTQGRDYQFSEKWAALGRLEGGAIGPDSAVKISYRYRPMRLDSVIAAPSGQLRYAIGRPAVALPELPPLQEGERRLLNVFLEPGTEKLERTNLYPIQETVAEPANAAANAAAQRRFLPNTLEKLRKGEKVRILAWGDSVTAGTYLPEAQRWQFQLVERLRRCYPAARIELITNGWGGRVMPSFHAEPPGSEFNYAETVLGAEPDLVISEFVNDAGMAPEVWPQAYSKTLADFRARGFEWIILTPHYIYPEGMGLTAQNGPALENDPRPYVAFLRKFAADHQIALADAAGRYGRLWREGIPYNIMMVNGINHPDGRGMAIYADALMAIFAAGEANH
ncbi:SGNH/GDSL hydrolase family protein [Victivallis sp. Marseille-Q1083]|uniref:SGNH/GDSL hydrolase family protein n=1 Tax=Victivallis sp. Marseille-Q1083 TaxID=2717288 RepID=UPI001588B233|nr:SGNH/GDSL hydrolase family protein [Victivallis sp. Marseille-Q1083]